VGSKQFTPGPHLGCGRDVRSIDDGEHGCAAGLECGSVGVPERRPSAAGSSPLALIAIALLIYQVARRPPRFELLRALIVVAAFVCWAANQLFPEIPQALLLNDVAIALFVLDVFLLIVSAPPASHEPELIGARFVEGTDFRRG
jgi:hypothetical protein